MASSGSDLEDFATAPSAPSPPPQTSLPTAAIRIGLGISIGAMIITILFTIWTLWNDNGGPAVGTMIFQLIAMGALLVVVYYAIFKRQE